MKALYVSRSLGDPPRRLTRVMSKPVTTVSAGESLSDALTLMVRKGLRHLAVLDADGRCVGVLADRAIAAAWAADPGGLARRTVSTVLDPTPPLLPEAATVLDAARLMRRQGIDAVVVVDGAGVAVGMVTGSDLVGVLAG